MSTLRLADLLDMSLVQRLADSNFRASGLPLSIIDAFDTSILVQAGWQDICLKFHRAHPLSRKRCLESDSSVTGRLVDGEFYQYKCKNGLWHVAIPIIVGGQHLATMFLTQFYFEGEVPERDFFIRQAQEFGYDVDAYLAALDRMPVFSTEKVNYILAYDKALARFIADLAEHSLRVVETQTSLRESEEKYRTLVNNVHVGVYRNDGVNGQFIQANPAMARMFGYDSVADFVEIGMSDLYQNPEDRKSLIEEITHDSFVRDKELAMQKKDGQSIWCSCTATAQYDDAGNIKWIDGVIEDITDRREAREALQRAHDELEIRVQLRTADLLRVNELLNAENLERKRAEEEIIKLNCELGEFTNELEALISERTMNIMALSIADKVRNPVTVIAGAARRALEKGGSPAELQESLQLVTDSAKQLEAIVNDFQVLLKSRQFLFRYENLNDLVKWVMPPIMREAQAKGIEVITRYTDQPLMINAQQHLLKAAVYHVLKNALEATPSGGTVSVTTVRKGDRIMFVVHDSGPGIPVENVEKVFDPLFSTKEYHFGMGLPLVKQVVTEHLGEVRIESALGEGTSLTLIFPSRWKER